MDNKELVLSTDGYFWTTKDGRYDKKYSLSIDDTGKVVAKEQKEDKEKHTLKCQFPQVYVYNTKKYGELKFCIVSANLMYFYYDVALDLCVCDAFKKFIKLKEIRANDNIMYFKNIEANTPYGACCGLAYCEIPNESYY